MIPGKSITVPKIKSDVKKLKYRYIQNHVFNKYAPEVLKKYTLYFFKAGNLFCSIPLRGSV